MKPLNTDEIEVGLQDLNGWVYENGTLQNAFEFNDFKEAFTAMTRIAFEAEKMNHHPNWANVYNYLEISLSTHSADGVTEKDFKLARIIDELIA
ncbi:MAG TPA: 4a-hydroxytetrahydrobiopterin dehydratase [Flavobacteriaceae bacterium]|nr:4a-hydroxytetrahydrobiopterin dehydratase [Flavobacteriaceae bacterium]MCB9213321.1 4a-hydroxytetrahydrobiopterin dehydratase [Alteromonas sp.]HPF10211.1 4a-hydroxytetrahydrobiopterin dehydratase [Flavobacteriaceae bacterium]HQU20657.1 4a-hydroxytetrahydrobiopterin dehydratase [Flavobacteriaceae bacterium]HQU64925.1 4a-hydroxytetrahydrobiopterin dehydratase [Flavobacteriaceae bacterium]